ncbi:MAG: methylglyoxal synthase [Spirochaetia bacterium]|nr:methylglyoxal synthase [Spirochaetia bacterium]
MIHKTVPEIKTIALIAHDNRKRDLLSWVMQHREVLKAHKLVGTGTTGSLISEKCKLPVKRFLSGPLGGDQQIGAEVCTGQIDLIIFFWDPLTSQPHDPDVKALLRLSVLYNVPTACNVSTADFMISSKFFHEEFTKAIIDFANRKPPVYVD